jgi:hypothetical protein
VGAMAGVALSAVCSKRPISLSGFRLAYFVLLCGLMWAGYANSFSDVPFLSYVLPPLSPLVYALYPSKPSDSVQQCPYDYRRAAASLAPCAIAVVLALMMNADAFEQ